MKHLKIIMKVLMFQPPCFDISGVKKSLVLVPRAC